MIKSMGRNLIKLCIICVDIAILCSIMEVSFEMSNFQLAIEQWDKLQSNGEV